MREVTDLQLLVHIPGLHVHGKERKEKKPPHPRSSMEGFVRSCALPGAWLVNTFPARLELSRWKRVMRSFTQFLTFASDPSVRGTAETGKALAIASCLCRPPSSTRCPKWDLQEVQLFGGPPRETPDQVKGGTVPPQRDRASSVPL